MEYREIGEHDEGEIEDFEDFGSFKFENEGDVIEGKVVGITDSDYNTSDGDMIYGYIIKIDDGVGRIVWASASHLRTKMKEIDVGDEVRITFDGTAKTDKGFDLKLFTVEVGVPE